MTRPPGATLAEAAALLTGGQTARALALLQPARGKHPRHAGIALCLADAHHAAAQLAEAVAAYTDGLRLDEASADGWYGLGCAQLALKAYGASAQALGRASVLAPNAGAPHYNLAKALFELGHVGQAIEHFEKAALLEPALERMARASIACIVPGSFSADHRVVLNARRAWADGEAGASAAPIAALASRRGKLRIGYLSAFFGARNWMKPVFALINRHDRSAFEIVLLSEGDLPCAASGYRDHDADMVFDIRGVGNDQAASIIREARIDVLVDLNGYSFQSRLPLLSQRPAPHIVGWFNMFATTGVAGVDWLVGDAAVIRAEEERYYTERIHRLDGTYLAFEVLYPVPDVAPPPCCTADGRVIFGCLGSHYKLTDAVLSAWGRIMRAAPRAALFIKNGTLHDASVRDEFTARLLGVGIDPGRAVLDGRSEHFDFLDAYRHVDVALDTFPYNGGTTTTEALWQGVPVLAFDGDRWAARTSKSLLLAANMAEWVMPDVDAYVQRAVYLANDADTPAKLRVLRAGLRNRLRAAPVCDAGALCSGMERFYRALVTGV